MDGMGVALGMTVLTGSDLASGRLVAPLALSLPLKFGYYIVSGADTAERSDVAAFRNWLPAEATRETKKS
jgi:LysR family glycine cleavage system transcriptional activator